MEDTRSVQVRDDTCIRMVGNGCRKTESKIGKAWSLAGERKFCPSVSDQENKTQARRNLTGNYCTGGACLVAQTVKKSSCNAGDWGSIPRSGRSPGKENGNPLQYSCLENPMERGAWWVTVHGVAENQI